MPPVSPGSRLATVPTSCDLSGIQQDVYEPGKGCGKGGYSSPSNEGKATSAARRWSRRSSEGNVAQEGVDDDPGAPGDAGKEIMPKFVSCPTMMWDLAGMESKESTKTNGLTKKKGNLRAIASAPGLRNLTQQHAPQALPHSELGLEGCEALRMPALASIASCVDVALWGQQGEDSGRSDSPAGDPVLQVGEWVFRGDMKVLYDGSNSLSNSTIKMGSATDGNDREEMMVAMKTVSFGADVQSIEMLRREIGILRALGDCHPNILPLLYCAEMPSELVLLTCYAPEGDLSAVMPRNSPLCHLEVRRLALQLLSALGFLHSNSIIHGDVKPQNLFLTRVNEKMLVRLSDFGLSVKVPDGDEFVKLPGVQGSYGYIPVEVIQRGELRYAADIFAMGVMVFRYLAAYDPFYPPSKVTEPLEFDESTWGLSPPEAQDFVVRVLATDPSERGCPEALLRDDPWLAAEDEAMESSAEAIPKFVTLTEAGSWWRRSPTRSRASSSEHGSKSP